MERSKNTFLCSHITKSEFGLKFCTSCSLLYLLSSVFSMRLNLCLPEGSFVNRFVPVSLRFCPLYGLCVHVCACLCVCMYIMKCLYILKASKAPQGGREGCSALQKNWQEFYKELNHWLQMIPTDPDNGHHCLWTNSHKWLLLTFMADFRELLSNSVFAAFSKWYTRIICVGDMEIYII